MRWIETSYYKLFLRRIVMMQLEIPLSEQSGDLPKLEVTCSSTNCDVGLHYFGPAHRSKSKYPVGVCKDCGADLVEWDRVRRRSAADVSYTLEMIKRECWRHDWWHRDIDIRALNHAKRKGRKLLREHCRELLAKKVGTAEPFRDGAQTPKDKNVIYYAQHATGTCCRKCLEYWHGIKPGVEIAAEQLDYLTDLAMQFV